MLLCVFHYIIAWNELLGDIMLLIISQIIGITGVSLYLLSFQLEKRKHIVLVTCLSNIMYVSQYLLLGAFSGAIMDILSTVSSFFATRKNTPAFKKYVKLIMALSISVIAVVGVILATIEKDYIELLPVVGAIFQTGGLWFDDEQTIRKFGLCGSPFWLLYNFISQAYGAALGSALVIISIIISMIRYRKR